MKKDLKDKKYCGNIVKLHLHELHLLLNRISMYN